MATETMSCFIARGSASPRLEAVQRRCTPARRLCRDTQNSRAYSGFHFSSNDELASQNVFARSEHGLKGYIQYTRDGTDQHDLP
jgi:hypothetical protein